MLLIVINYLIIQLLDNLGNLVEIERDHKKRNSTFTKK